MGWVRGKLGGPCALFDHHSGQRHSDGSHARKFNPLRVLSTALIDSKRRFANLTSPVLAHPSSGLLLGLQALWSLLYCGHGTPKCATIEPIRISSQHLVVEFFFRRGLFREFLKIKNVLPRLSNHSQSVVIVLRILVASHDCERLQRLHRIQSREPFIVFVILV